MLCVDAFFVSLCAIILCSVEFFSVCVHASLLFDLASVFIVGGDTEFRVSPELPFCFVRSCTFKCFNAWPSGLVIGVELVENKSVYFNTILLFMQAQ